MIWSQLFSFHACANLPLECTLGRTAEAAGNNKLIDSILSSGVIVYSCNFENVDAVRIRERATTAKIGETWGRLEPPLRQPKWKSLLRRPFTQFNDPFSIPARFSFASWTVILVDAFQRQPRESIRRISPELWCTATFVPEFLRSFEFTAHVHGIAKIRCPELLFELGRTNARLETPELSAMDPLLEPDVGSLDPS